MEKEIYEQLITKIKNGSEKQQLFKQYLNDVKGIVERVAQVCDILALAEKSNLPVSQFFTSDNGMNLVSVFNATNRQLAFVVDKTDNWGKKNYEIWYLDKDGTIYTSNYYYDYSKHTFSDTFAFTNPSTDANRLDIQIENLKSIISNFNAFEIKVINFIKNC